MKNKYLVLLCITFVSGLHTQEENKEPSKMIQKSNDEIVGGSFLAGTGFVLYAMKNLIDSFVYQSLNYTYKQVPGITMSNSYSFDKREHVFVELSSNDTQKLALSKAGKAVISGLLGYYFLRKSFTAIDDQKKDKIKSTELCKKNCSKSPGLIAVIQSFCGFYLLNKSENYWIRSKFFSEEGSSIFKLELRSSQIRLFLGLIGLVSGLMNARCFAVHEKTQKLIF